ncbi:MAG TPA: STAS domain-containing protein [Verrucomicrobiae bacterium]|nr:STAS domain-containing protein [Verrucomicrobiae bacterium]
MEVHRPVIVMQLPDHLNREAVGEFLNDLTPLLEPHRPRIVLDCSQVTHIDSAGVEMLLHCLAEAMKRDGDLKLAAVSPESKIILELMRVEGIFEMFETAEKAARSFDVSVPDLAPNDVWHAGPSNLESLRRAS